MNLDYFLPFGLYIIGILIVAFTFRRKLYRSNDTHKVSLETMLKAEQQVKFIRPKVLSDDLFLKVHLSDYPVVDDVDCQNDYQTLKESIQLPMVNFQNYTNLELKQMYGPQMLDTITQYETNYVQFMEASIAYGKSLYEHHYIEEARKTLEQCMLYKCNISIGYTLLIEIYKLQNDTAALHRLEPIIKQEMQNSPFLNKVLGCLQG